MKLFYVDIVRGSKISLLAGPFASEEIARKYEKVAFDKALEFDPWVAFDKFGVLSIDPADDVLMLGNKIAIEHRFWPPIADGIEDAGLVYA